ncbi:uncharacterized protein LOC136068572 [Quercus suber]|uniref:uncharacterized protein LOC136068572 n=1 Tax=Quercus suber TaxID=58331 RepID=UPI0032DE4655
MMKVKILPDADKCFHIGKSMDEQDKVEMLLLLIQNVDVFAWSPYEVPEVDPEFIVHRLRVDPSFPSKKQKPRRSAREHAEAVRMEVQKLKDAGEIREIFFSEWLANTVVVKKKNGKWRVCVDFTDLNRACPKDSFPVPMVDQLVDATYRHSRISFLDAFQRYHQIALVPEDQEKTTFITPKANYHYTVMPFGLKNAGATYTGVELKCWVRGKEFSINPKYIAKVLRINRPENVDLTPYDDRLPKVQDIFQILGPDHEISSKGTSIGTAKFALDLMTLKLIMFFNLYPLSNTAFINLGRAQFLCDLITGVSIDICAHIFQTIGKTTARTAARTCLPFCSLLMKIMVLEGVHPPTDGTILAPLRPLSMISLQARKSHSSKVPKSESFIHATSSGHGSVMPMHTETASPHTPELQTTSTQPLPSSSQADRMTTLIEGLY